ncbi:hypothetical protein AX15_002877 [Amanita polypyramis BW_CC]|nr:hypothetical protein AX15_002877 [Amanita polypyramis BW_CC]
MVEDHIYDVIIVGGGIAGCSTALSLLHSNSKATFIILDDANPQLFKIGESLPSPAIQFLRYLSPTLISSLEDGTRQGKHLHSTGNASAWTSGDIHEQHSILNPFGKGWHLDRALFDQSFRDAVSDLTADNPHNGLIKARFSSIEKQNDVWHVFAEDLRTENQCHYQGRWVIDATGRKASVAHKIGAKTIKSDSLLAFYALFESCEEDEEHHVLIEAAESGWWYTTQLAENKRIIVYHTDDDEPPSKIARKPDGFMQLLYETVHVLKVVQNYGYSILENYPRCTAAWSSILHPLCDEEKRWCAVGDAAMAFDPLSSQGMIAALSVGCFVGELIGSSGGVNADSISEYHDKVGKKYEKEKKYYYGQVPRFSKKFWRKRH